MLRVSPAMSSVKVFYTIKLKSGRNKSYVHRKFKELPHSNVDRSAHSNSFPNCIGRVLSY